MSNTGHTTIEATGSPPDLAALAAYLRGTARGSSAFTLSALMHPDPAPDHAVRWAELSATDEMVSLSIGITYDRDALGVAARIAGRFPTLRILAFFVAECDEAAFDALCFAGGKLAYQAHFDDEICFPVPAPGLGGRCTSLVRFFQRTHARSAAASDHFNPAVLAQFANQPDVAGKWRDVVADGPGIRVWWRPGAADGTCQALVARDGALTLLSGMDCYGGYGHKEQLDAAVAFRRLPELAAEIERHLHEHAADQMALKLLQACRSDPDDFEVPF